VEETIVITFMEKTWFMWWMFAIVVIVRWFHALPWDTESEALQSPVSKEEQVSLDPGEFASHSASSLFV
jgi:hypothetical protein